MKTKLKDQIDKLINAYETPGVRRGPEEIPVRCKAKDLSFAHTEPNGKICYRGRTLVPLVK